MQHSGSCPSRGTMSPIEGELPGADFQSAWKLSFRPALPHSLGEENEPFRESTDTAL